MAVMPFFVMLILQPFVDLAPGDGLEEGGGTGAGLGTVASFIRAPGAALPHLQVGQPHGSAWLQRHEKETKGALKGAEDTPRG